MPYCSFIKRAVAKLYCHSLSPFLFHDIILSSENYKGSATKYLIYFLFIIDNVEHMFELLLLNMRSIFLKRQKFRFFSFFSRSIFSFLFSSIIHGIYCICVFALSFPMALGLLPVVASTSTAAAAAASVSRHT